MKKVFVIDEQDNVGTAVLEPLSAGDEAGTTGAVNVTFKVKSDIPFGHKVALRDIAAGETVLKYGLSIGNAIRDIKAGDHVHVHNVESNRGRGDKFVDSKGVSA